MLLSATSGMNKELNSMNEMNKDTSFRIAMQQTVIRTFDYPCTALLTTHNHDLHISSSSSSFSLSLSQQLFFTHYLFNFHN